jgi:hypothetical protein
MTTWKDETVGEGVVDPPGRSKTTMTKATTRPDDDNDGETILTVAGRRRLGGIDGASSRRV